MKKNTILDRLRLQIGYLGRIFGIKEHAPTNIAGLLIFVIIVFGIYVTMSKTAIDPNNYWDKAFTIILGTIGYIFGRGSR
jgi:hypothetical protein